MREKAHATLVVLLLAGCPANEVIEGTSAGPESSGTDASTSAAEPTTAADGTASGTTTSSPASSTGAVTTANSTSGTSDTSTSDTSTSDTSMSGDTSDTTSTSDTHGGHTLVIEGLGEFPVTCELDDADCGARTACELTTNEPCEYVEYDCQLLNVGSYTIAAFYDTPRDFSFALYPLIERSDFGNICSCLRTPSEGKALLQSYGLATDHEWCGLGRWFLK